MWDIYLLICSIHSKTLINLEEREVLFSSVFQSRAFHDGFGGSKDEQEKAVYGFSKCRKAIAQEALVLAPQTQTAVNVLSPWRGLWLTETQLNVPLWAVTPTTTVHL